MTLNDICKKIYEGKEVVNKTNEVIRYLEERGEEPNEENIKRVMNSLSVVCSQYRKNRGIKMKDVGEVMINRIIKVNPGDWEKLGIIAKGRGTTRLQMIRDCIKNIIKEYDV